MEDRKDEHLLQLRRMLESGNDGGNDLTKRNYAIMTLCGRPTHDGKQTDRLLKLAIAVLEARG
jgi:hypothetical protein